MTANALLAVVENGTPVSLSQGVRLISREGYNRHAGIVVRTSHEGGFAAELIGPEFTPTSNSWETLDKFPAHPGAVAALAPLFATAMGFEDLTSPEVFWKADKLNGTHVLMDTRSKKLVRVSPLESTVCGPFWSSIPLALEGKPSDIDAECRMGKVWNTHNLFETGVWLCLHPAPFNPDKPVLWVFNGQTHVAFPTSPPIESEAGEVFAADMTRGAAAVLV